MATPPKINLSIDILFALFASIKTNNVVKIAPDHEANGINNCESPNVINVTITKPEPADMPNKYGLAKLFLSIPCKSAPETPKDDPTNKDAINRGNLSSQIIICVSASPF